MSRGIMWFGVNNTKIDYLKITVASALYAKANMPNVSRCVVTNTGSLEYFKSTNSLDINSIFDDIIIIDAADHKTLFENSRQYRNTRYYSVAEKFKNEYRVDAYNLSPYDETLLIDSDYFICSDALNAVWGCEQDVLINNDALSLLHKPLLGQEFYVSDQGVRMYWATVVYFKKSKRAEIFFMLMDKVKRNWAYFKTVFDFPGGLFRNDYAASVAIHMMSDSSGINEEFGKLPYQQIVTSTEFDQLYKMHDFQTITLLANRDDENWRFHATTLQGIDVHIMNKLSLVPFLDYVIKGFK